MKSKTKVKLIGGFYANLFIIRFDDVNKFSMIRLKDFKNIKDKSIIFDRRDNANFLNVWYKRKDKLTFEFSHEEDLEPNKTPLVKPVKNTIQADTIGLPPKIELKDNKELDYKIKGVANIETPKNIESIDDDGNITYKNES